MNEMINRIGDRMVVKARVVNLAVEEGDYAHNIRECPTYSEFYGMIELLKTMGIEYDIEFNREVTHMTAIVIMGKRFEV